MSSTFSTLPSDWELSRIDRVATVRARIGWKALSAAEYMSEGYTFLSTPNIKGDEIDFENVNYITEHRYQESPELRLMVGDVLLVKDGNTLGITNMVRALPRPATVNGSIAVVRATGIDPGFLRYVLASGPTQGLIRAVKDGMGVPHLFQRDINRLPVPLPPSAEQRRLADFLDAETARIDRLIALRQRQVALLEQRPWTLLGQIVTSEDANWIPLRRALTFLSDGPFGSAFSSGDYVDHGAAVVRLGNIGFAMYRGEAQAFIPTSVWATFPRCHVRPGDLLIAGLGDANNHAGRACVAPDLGAALVKGKCFVARVDGRVVSAHYLALLLSSRIGRDVITLEAQGSTRAMINLEIVKSAVLPLPPRLVQDRVVDAVEASSSTGLALRSSALRQVALLVERRQALITAAVTGQLDVTTSRGVA